MFFIVLRTEGYGKNRVAYCESREQALIGDKTLIFGVKYEEMVRLKTNLFLRGSNAYFRYSYVGLHTDDTCYISGHRVV